jgi:hypothetical protein
MFQILSLLMNFVFSTALLIFYYNFAKIKNTENEAIYRTVSVSSQNSLNSQSINEGSFVCLEDQHKESEALCKKK